eukprot:TRINITY_DN7116_c0_g1_i1.p1 TRINITY_DN7116_c0_g1~~TRINITY_DN7116_c0_g1_i1.p1  ORF type:complete len:509 (+),score=108.86 TRINITY_DN7116_c0_g1_i1:52-1527(+)
MATPATGDEVPDSPRVIGGVACAEDAAMEDPAAHMPRHLSTLGGAAVVAGTIIGSGIFASPGSTLKSIGSPSAALLLWVTGGFAAVCGGMCYAELGAAMPQSGGEAVYLERAYGERVSFLFSWTMITVCRPASVAIVSGVCGDYVSRLYGGRAGPWGSRLTSLTCVLLITIINMVSLKATSMAQTGLTALKVGALAALALAGVLFGDWSTVGTAVVSFENTTTSIGDVGVALNTALWAFDGWGNLNVAAGELKDPTAMPSAIALGTGACVVLYLCVNLSYLLVLGPGKLANTNAAASDFASELLGAGAGSVLADGIVCLSTFSSSLGTLFAASRLLQSQAAKADWALGKVNPRTRTPVAAIALQALMAAALICVGDFESLVSYFGVAAWLFYGTSVAAVVVLRRSEPDLPRPFKVPLVVPFIFCMFAVVVVVTPVLSNPVHTLGSFGMVALGLPLRYAFQKSTERLARRHGVQRDIAMAPADAPWDKAGDV